MGKIKQLFTFFRKKPLFLLLFIVFVSLSTFLIKVSSDFISDFLIRPQIISTMPMEGDIEVPLDSAVIITFSRPMNEESVEENFVISPQIEGDFTWEGNSLKFTPRKPFIRDQKITVEIGEGALGSNFLPLNKDPGMTSQKVSSVEKFTFETVSNPQVAMASPKGSIAEKVTNIVVMFNKSIKKPEGSILEVVPEISGEEKWVGSSAYMIKSDDLVKGEKYTVRLIKDLESVDGGKLSKGYEFEFVNFAPAILDMSSESASYNDNSEVDPRGPFTVYFNQNIDRESLRDRIRLFEKSNRAQIPFNVYFSDRTKEDDNDYYYGYSRRGWEQKVEIYPQQALNPKTSYTLQVDSGFKSFQGNAVAENGRSLNFVTAALPGFRKSNIKDGQTEVGEDRLTLYFNSPMSSEEIKRNVVVKKDGVISNENFFVSAYRNQVTFNRYLDRSTFYEFYIPSGVKDAYGRTLGEEVYVSFNTAPRSPSISIYPRKYSISTFADNVDTRIISRVVNTPKLEYNLYSLNLDTFMDVYELRSSARRKLTPEFLASECEGFGFMQSWTSEVDLEQDVPTDVLFNVNRDMDIDLSPGYYFLTINSLSSAESKPVDNIVFVVGDVSLTQKMSHDKTFIWAASLSKQEVKSNYDVSVYKLGQNRKIQSLTEEKSGERKPLFTGQTNSQGVLFSDFKINSNYNNAYLTVVKRGSDVGIVVDDWSDGISSYQFSNVNYSSSWNEKGPPKYKAFAFTDRRLYRPGHTVHYTAFLRNNRLYEFTPVNDGGKLTVSIAHQRNYYNSGQESLFTRTYEVFENDMFSGEFDLPEGLKLGRYYLEVRYNEKKLYTSSFDVQEYVRPEFEVIAEVPEGKVIRGNNIKVASKANYFYGAPLRGNDVSYSLYKRNYIFRSKEYSDYNFYSRRKYYGEDAYWRGFEEKEVLENSGVTDSKGEVALYPSTLTQDGVTEVFTLETQVTGDNGKKLAGSGEYIVHMAEHYTGIKSESYLGKVGNESSFEIVTLSPEGDEISDVEVNVNVYLRKYYRTKKKDNSEGYLYEVTYEDELIKSEELTTGYDGMEEFSFEPENAGTHIIEVQSFDEEGNRSISDLFHYVSSNESGYWRRENHDRIELVTDKEEYKVGDRAEVLPISTQEEAIGLLTIEGEEVLEYEVFKQNNSGEVRGFKVKNSHLPNAYVSIILISPGTSDQNPAEFKMGISNFKVDLSDNQLNLEITSNKDSYSPKEKGEARIIVKDSSGDRVSNSLVSVALVDDALMSIASLKRSDVFKHFYSPRYYGLRNSQSLVKSLDRVNLNTEIGAKGGSGSKGGAGNQYPDLTRSNFAETALWEAEVRTDKNGEALIEFQLPDSITRWNLFALVQDDSGSKFGQGVHKFGSARKMFVKPSLPRFMRVEDQADLGLVVHNNTAQTKDFKTGIEAKGLNINGPYVRNISVGPNSTEKLYFDSVAQDVDLATVTFTLEESGQVQDVVVKEFPVLPYGLEVVQSVSNVVNYSAMEEFKVEDGVNKEYGGLDIKVHGSMLGIAERTLSKLEYNNYLSVSSLQRKTVPLIYKYRLKEFLESGDNEYLERTIRNNISLILSAQRSDGGWGYWKDSDKSSEHYTTLALETLGEAQKAGFDFNLKSMEKGKKYLEGELNKNYTTDVSPYTLYVLELVNSDQTGRISLEYKQRATLSDSNKSYLIMAMAENKSNWSSQISQLSSELALKADLGSGRIFWGGSYRGSDFYTTALVLRAFNRVDPKGPIANLAIKHLIQLKERGWKYVSRPERGKATAIMENVLLKNIRVRDSNVEILLNEDTVVTGKLEGKDPKSEVTQFIPTSQLSEGENLVELKLDKGGNAFYSMVLTSLVPFDIVEEESNEIGLSREIYDLEGNPISDNIFEVGEMYVVRLTIASPNIRRNVILEDFLPGGFESINESLQNEAALSVDQARKPVEGRRLYLIDTQQMRDSSTQLHMSYVPKGLYEYAYLVRAIVPGEFKYRPAHIFEQNSPDIRANTEGFYITVVD